MNYTIIPYTSGLPGASSTTLLFSSIAFSAAALSLQQRFGGYARYLLAVRNSAPGTLKVSGSSDGGVTWQEIDEVAMAAATATRMNKVAFALQPHYDVKVEWINGGVAQTTFYLAQGLDDGNSPLRTVFLDALGSADPEDTQAVTTTQLPTSLGQKTKAGSLPVVLPSDQLGTQTKANSLSITPATDQLGQAAKAASFPVVLPSDQLGTQTKANSLSITPATDQLGQATKAASFPVVLPSDQLGSQTKANSLSTVPATDSLGQGTKAQSLPVVLASDDHLKGQLSATTAAGAAEAANVIGLAQYLAANPTLTDTQVRSLLLDVAGNLNVTLARLLSGEDQTNNLIAFAHLPTPLATYAWSVAQVAALATSLVVKSGAGKLKSIKGRIDSTATAADYYVLILNASAVPANGAVTHLWPPQKIKGHVTTGDDKFDIDFGAEGIYASTGIVIALSTTEFTLTIAGAWLSAGAEFK